MPRQRRCRPTNHDAAVSASPILFDATRLLRRAGVLLPTGVDRVEIAYARHLLDHAPARTTFITRSPLGWHPVAAEEIARIVSAEGMPGGALAQIRASHAGNLLLRGMRRLPPSRDAVYLNVGHVNLQHQGAIEKLLAAQNARFVALVHDLIPLTHPEYARAGEPDRHASRMATLSRLAASIIANSGSTARELRAYLDDRRMRVPSIHIAPLGLDRAIGARGDGEDANRFSDRPYFVVLGTIEGRKNHLLLLHLWRAFAEAGAVPGRLLVIGRRGWENEQVLDLLDRAPLLRDHVVEIPRMADAELAAVLGGARALLFPSFAEGYGLPLGEALALGVPVIASDLPALREVGMHAPDYLDPLDGPAWRAAICDYAEDASIRRAAQITRIAAWSAPGWNDHFARIGHLLD